MSRYIKFTFTNQEQLRISDDSRSQSGQTSSRSYIPGSAIRGAVIERLLSQGKFDNNYNTVLREICFLNAYPVMNNLEMIPSPKGFYEDKTEETADGKQIENMLLDGRITPGYKRAALGQYVYTKDNCLCYASVHHSTDMKIRRGKGEDKKVFRNDAINSGYTFSAYIRVENEEQEVLIRDAVEEIKNHNALYLGGGRSYGFGKCQIQEIETSAVIPYSNYALANPGEGSLYLYLLSDMAMQDEYGENVGIDPKKLGSMLGLSGPVTIERCSTSVVDIRGFNRKLGSFIPSVRMYEMGSVFKLTFEGSIEAERLAAIMDHGIGMRREEGFGRVLFFRAFEALTNKQKIAETEKEAKKITLNEEDGQVLEVIAKGYYQNKIEQAVQRYVLQNDLSKFHLNASQVGAVSSILLQNMYHSKNEVENALNDFFMNMDEKAGKQRILGKDKQKHYSGFGKYIQEVLSENFAELFADAKIEFPQSVMGYTAEQALGEQAVLSAKLRMIFQLISMNNRAQSEKGGR